MSNSSEKARQDLALPVVIRPDIFRQFAPLLVLWQKEMGRHDLPWQKTRDPYKVWLSEIMLQQTQVSTVKMYYQRFLEAFPSVQDLAAADEAQVMGLWSGLGYYSRARNLHRCAQIIEQQYGGVFPEGFDALMALPGIGRSTAAAIAAFCFGARVSILDGNVKRVLTRVLAFGEDISSARVDKVLWEVAQSLVPTMAFIRKNGGVHLTMSAYTQGLMDLGAGICLPRRANCLVCPMEKICQAHRTGLELCFPNKTRKVKRSVQSGYLLWLASPLGVWLMQRPSRGIWGGLFSMPVFETQAQRDAVIQALNVQPQALPAFKHVLTHMDWILQPHLVELNAQQVKNLPAAISGLQGQWFTRNQWTTLGLPAPIRRLLEMSSDL